MSGLSPGPGHLLDVLLVLVCWAGSLASGTSAQVDIPALHVEKQTNVSVTLTWEPPNESSPRYIVTWAKEGQLLGTNGTTATQYTVENLQPGTLYEFTVEVEGNSSGKSLNAATVPNEVEALSMKARSNSSVTLQWAVPKGPQYSDYTYWISWSKKNVLVGEANTTKTEHVVEGLDAATEYTFRVKAERNNISISGLSARWPQVLKAPVLELHLLDQLDRRLSLLGKPVQQTEHVVEAWAATEAVSDVPNEVEDLSMKAPSNSSVTLQWGVPKGPQYSDYTYWISWSKENVLVGEASTTKTEHVVEGLEAATEYNFTVKAERNNVSSSGLSRPVATVPNEVEDLSMKARSNSSVTLQWGVPKGPHSDYTYWISWSKENVLVGEASTMKTEHVVEGLEAATEYTFIVKAERNNVSSSSQSLLVATVPNEVEALRMKAQSNSSVTLQWEVPKGPQYSDYTYWISWSKENVLVGETNTTKTEHVVEGLDAATEYNFTVKPERNNVNSSGLSFLVATVPNEVEALRMKARSNSSVTLQWGVPKGPQYSDYTYWISWSKKNGLVGEANTTKTEHVVEGLDAATEYTFRVKAERNNISISGLSRPVATVPNEVEDLSMKARSNSSVTLQWAVPKGPQYSDYTYWISWSKENVLVGKPVADPGMWWRSLDAATELLGNLLSQVKCEHYWPLDAQTCNHGRLQVTLKGEDVAEHWTIRDLQLFHMDLKESLSVRQFHFTAWPDHGVPRSPDPLLAFQALLRQWLEQSPEGGPPIVHCSAGVGRTGTLIALDVLLRQLQKYRHVGVQSFIRKMRRSRPLMVQTEGQYIFLYQTLLRFQQRSQAAEDTSRAQEEILYENVGAIQAYEQEMRVI
ncbi:receptor-type tyrosine-protein phosphatase H [Sarcophilus harrisii]|uniref:receptor-type tyrosine-protein phosphatase H n=1 Tax=Sarcophilus harrisii TaxID=9305 RepID=UPI001301D4C1|nr:receptor-type tyrosine-protein phosphatase H [Sarcophilus harrisii]